MLRTERAKTAGVGIKKLVGISLMLVATTSGLIVCGRKGQYIIMYMLLRDEKEGRSKQGQTNNKAKQHSTPKADTFPNASGGTQYSNMLVWNPNIACCRCHGYLDNDTLGSVLSPKGL